MNRNKYISLFATICLLNSSSLYTPTLSYANNYIDINSINLNTNSIDESTIEIKDFGCTEAINKYLSKAEFYLNEYKATSNLIHLYSANTNFSEIAKVCSEDEFVYLEPNAPVDVMFENIRNEIYLIADENTKSNLLIDLGEKILYSWRSNKISYLFIEYFLVTGLIDYNKFNPDGCSLAQEALEELKSFYSYMVNTEEGNIDSNVPPTLPELPDIDFTPIPPEETPENNGDMYVPEENPNPPSTNVEIDVPKETLSYSSEYKKVGNTCVLVELTHKDGAIIERNEKTLPKEDYVYCGIYDYIFDNINQNNNNNGFSGFDDNTVIDEDYINEDQNVESNKYIFYTVSKGSAKPYYYNSGIRATIDGIVTYNQLKDVLYQVVVKTKGFSIDDNQKSLSIINGKPIVLYAESDIYEEDFVEKLLDNIDSVDLDIKEDGETTSTSDLENMIKNKEMITIKYNDTDIQVDDLKIQNSFILASIESIPKHFDYEVLVDNSSITLKKEKTTITISLNSNEYTINGTKHNLKSSIIDDSGYYLDISTLFDILGYSVYWDTQSLCFNVENK